MASVTRLARRFHYGWVIAVLTFFVLLVSAGLRAAPGVLIVPLEDDFGWSRATISLAVSINLLMYGVTGPFAAALMERIGMRASMLLALAVMASGFGLTTIMTAPWQLIILWGFVVGGGTGMAALVFGAMVVNRWFTTHRGLVMGVLTASMAGGQLVFLPLLATMVERWGWRLAVGGAVAAAATLVPLVALLMREHPQDVGLQPYGETGILVRPPAQLGNPITVAFEALGQNIGNRDFWLLCASFFICGLSTNGLIGTHLIPACLDHGMSEVAAAGLLGGMGVFNFIGTTASGWLSDRLDNRRLLFWYYGLRGLSLILLPYAFDYSVMGLSVFAIFYGLDWIATVPPTVRLTANAFGAANAGMMFGWIMIAHQLGSATAAFGAGIVRTEFDNYTGAFLASGLLCLLASLIVLRIGVTPRGIRRAAPGAVSGSASGL
jgi:MFS family permease